MASFSNLLIKYSTELKISCQEMLREHAHHVTKMFTLCLPESDKLIKNKLCNN